MKKIILMLLLLLLSFDFAFADDVEIARVSAHYAHPITNVVEDSGKNAEIGQGMTESVLSPQALIETDNTGIYATFRFNMTDQISSIKISKQKAGDSSFTSVSPKQMQSTEKTKDLRIKLDSKNSIIRVEAFVEPMGRAVIFYGMIGETTRGNTDFVVSVNPTDDKNTKTNTEEKNIKNENQAINNDSSLNSNEIEDKAKIDFTNETIEEKIVSNEEISLYDDKGLLLKGDTRLSLGEENDNKDSKLYETQTEELGDITKIAIGSIFIVFGTVSVLVFVISIFEMILFYKIRRKNDIEEAKAYGFKN